MKDLRFIEMIKELLLEIIIQEAIRHQEVLMLTENL